MAAYVFSWPEIPSNSKQKDKCFQGRDLVEMIKNCFTRYLISDVIPCGTYLSVGMKWSSNDRRDIPAVLQSPVSVGTTGRNLHLLFSLKYSFRKLPWNTKAWEDKAPGIAHISGPIYVLRCLHSTHVT
jgi:hypothetical protein